MLAPLTRNNQPPKWCITAERDLRGERHVVLTIGERRPIPIADIASVSLDTISERGDRGLWTMTVFFGLAAVAILIGVIGHDWRTRFLIGAGLLAALAATSLAEAFAAARIGYRRLSIVTHRGERTVFASAEPGEVEQLARALASVGCHARA